MIATVFHFGRTSFRVIHEPCTEPEGRIGPGLLLRAENCEPNTLTSVAMGSLDDASTLYVFWRPVTAPLHFDLLFVEHTRMLFVGAGTLSASINLTSMSIVRENVVDLFWSFERIRNFILELGELDCFLYKEDGECVGTASVDPPYEVHETDSGINFVSSLYGKQWIHYPNCHDDSPT